jgi:exodeoxyribonuclease VII small subunit
VTVDEALVKLEQVTRRLEEEGLPLEEAISLFEEGIALAARIKGQLDEAKLKVERVIEEAKGVFTLEDLDLP